MISDAPLLYLGLGLAPSECQQWRTFLHLVMRYNVTFGRRSHEITYPPVLTGPGDKLLGESCFVLSLLSNEKLFQFYQNKETVNNNVT